MESTQFVTDSLSMLLKSKGKSNGSLFDREQIFYEYKDKAAVAVDILDSIMRFYNDEKQGFALDDSYNKDKYGTITHAMAMSTLLEVESLGADLSKVEKIFFTLIQKIFDSVYVDGKTVFNASPYIPESSKVCVDTYVESISKILITSVDLRSSLLRRMRKSLPFVITCRGNQLRTTAELISAVEDLIVECIKALSDSCLENENPVEFQIDRQVVHRQDVSPVIAYRGWNFQKPNPSEHNKYATSIYYTYHATNAFLSFYTSLEEIMNKYYEGQEYEVIPDENMTDRQKEDVRIRDINEQFFLKNRQIIDEFRNKTISAGRYFEYVMRKNKIDLSFDYVGKDLNSVSTEAVMKGNNNSAIDTLFVVSILINAGIDDDYNSLENASKADEFFEGLQNALVNVKKIYTKMAQNKKEDLISSYTLGDEVCSGAGEIVMQEFRRTCKTISTYEFIPLYCNTYATISKFLIKYPQVEMKNNLRWILEKKANDGWYWSFDGYDINNNLYYIFALENFYDYYDEYEKQFIGKLKSQAKIEGEKEAIRREYKAKIEKITESHKEKLEELNVEIAELKEKRSALDAEVLNLVEGSIGKFIDEYMLNLLDEGTEYLVRTFEIDSEEKRRELRKEYRDNVRLQILFRLSRAIDGNKNIHSESYQFSDEELEIKKKRFREASEENLLQKLLSDNIKGN